MFVSATFKQVVPTSVNDPGMFQNLVDSANIYGIDAYPVSFNCSNPTFWRDIPTGWRTDHKSITPEIPFLFPEYVHTDARNI